MDTSQNSANKDTVSKMLARVYLILNRQGRELKKESKQALSKNG